MLESDVKVPAALNLPFGQLFFGFHVAPYTPPPEPDATASRSSASDTSFGGTGHVLRDRRNNIQSSSSSKGKEKEKASPTEQPPTSWGQGHTLGSSPRPTLVQSSRLVAGPESGRSARNGVKQQTVRTPSPEWDFSDDEDVVMIDSD
jgi:ubiquitin fusion degradation protein 1